MRNFKIIEVNEVILEKALISEIDDFKDAVIDVSAKEYQADYILTRNTKDLKKGFVNAITPGELLTIA